MRSAESYAQEALDKRGYIVVAQSPGSTRRIEGPYPCKLPVPVVVLSRNGPVPVVVLSRNGSRNGSFSSEYLVCVGETDEADMRQQIDLFGWRGGWAPGTRFYRCKAD